MNGRALKKGLLTVCFLKSPSKSSADPACGSAAWELEGKRLEAKVAPTPFWGLELVQITSHTACAGRPNAPLPPGDRQVRLAAEAKTLI
jgi:hypothetical protein